MSAASEVRYALRAITRTPLLSVVVTITLALGIGATTAMLGIVDVVLLRPLPYADASRLVALNDVQGADITPASYPEYIDWRDRTGNTFAAVGAWFSTGGTLTGVGDPIALRSQRMSASVPLLLGTKPVLGRLFNTDDESPTAERVVMINARLWRERLGGAPDVIGRVLTINGFPARVVGVFPDQASSRLPNELASGRSSDYWVPLRLDAASAPRGMHLLSVIGAIRGARSLDAASSLLDQATSQLVRDSVTTHRAQLLSLTDRVVGAVRPRLMLLTGAVAVVLLIACANIANLLLARAASRNHELALRAALGATHADLATPILVESIVRAILGGACGVAVAAASLAIARTALLRQVPRIVEASLDWRIVAVAIVLTIVVGAVVGLLPAWRASRTDAGATLRGGGRGIFGTLGRDRFRKAMVVFEVAMSFVLLAGAGLMIRSLDRLMAVPKGFATESVVTAAIALPSNRYADAPHQAAFWSQLLDQLRNEHTVRAAGLASNLPIEGGVNGDVRIEGSAFPPGSAPIAEKRIVSAGYFEALRARVEQGRLFDARDIAGAPSVAVVNQAFARKYLSGGSAVGRQIDFAWDTEGLQEIVGVVADVKESGLDQPSLPAVYVPVAQRPSPSLYVTIRGTGNALDNIAVLRAATSRIDAALPLTEIRTLQDVVAGNAATQRVMTTLLAIFSSLALLLAAIGLYGVISYAVQQRTREFGVRTALGATPLSVLLLVMRSGLTLVAAGAVIGLLAALLLRRVVASYLFGIGASDPLTLSGVGVALLMVAMLAMAIPALRAARTDVVKALGQ